MVLLLLLLANQLDPTTPAATAPAEEAACRVVILNLQGRNLNIEDGEIPGLVTETLAHEVGLISGCSVVTQSDVAAMLDLEAQKAACDTGGESCLAEIGAALGAKQVIGGSLGRLESELILNVARMDVTKGNVEARAEQVVSGSGASLRTAAKNAARQLYGAELLSAPPPPPPPPLPVEEEKTTPTLLLAGAGVAGIGALVTVGGAIFVAIAESRLNDPGDGAKDEALGSGRVALGITAVGVTALATGATLAAVAVVE